MGADGKIYLTALKSLERVDAQYIPKEISWQRTATVADIAVVARNVPVRQQTGGGKDITIEFDFYAQQENREDVIEKVRQIESWTYRDGNTASERIRITFGKLFKPQEVWKIKSVTPKFSQFNKKYGLLPQQAYVSIALCLDVDNDITRREVKWT